MSRETHTNICTDCMEDLEQSEIKHNTDCGIEKDDWLCTVCEMQYGDNDGDE